MIFWLSVAPVNGKNRRERNWKRIHAWRMLWDMNSKVFIDTNVLMDVLLGNRPSSDASGIIFRAIKEGRLEGVITTQSLVDAAYCLEKKGLRFQDSFLKLFDFLNVETLDVFDLRHACIQNSCDFEDDAQYSKAEEVCCDFFVTNDRKFRRRYEAEEESIRFYTPEEMVREMVEEYRIDMETKMDNERLDRLVSERGHEPREASPGLSLDHGVSGVNNLERGGLERRYPTAEERANDPKLAYLREKLVAGKGSDL